LLTDSHALAWLTPDWRKKVANSDLRFVPLDDPQIRLDVHLATLINNNSPLVSEFVRNFMKRVEEQRGPMHLHLPIGLMASEALQE
jgi:hypothetical protein